jgi:long-chain acyl-CoA synthetase
MNLASAFAASAEHNQNKTALFWGENDYTHGHLLSQAQWFAHTLRSKFGVQPGDRVGIWLKNCPEFIPVLFGILGAGAIAVPINNFLKPAEVSHIVSDAGIKLLISEASPSEPLNESTRHIPDFRTVSTEIFAGATPVGSAGFAPAAHRTESDLAVIIYTSGTTGKPKGAMLSHGNLLHNVESCRQMLEASAGDRFVLLLPMFHSFMLTVCILLPMLIGGSIVLVKSLHPAKNIIQEILARQATILPAIPQFFRALAHAPLPPVLPLRLCVSGAAPLPHEVLKEFTARFPLPLLEGYGLSEASPVVSLNPLRGPWKAGSIGVPVTNVEVTIQDEQGCMLHAGGVGEICVRGGNVMQGYWNKPEETAQCMRNGWLLTGDVGHRDEDGYFYITDRKKDMLLVNGINVYPREIEEVLYQFTGVKEAAVVGVPDPRKGEQPVAFVSANEGVTLEERPILEFLREKLADYKIPRKVCFLPALPRNATGKILKTELRTLSRPETGA